ncbi:MAG TPA: CDP-glycerol glycerophosphotransferase family protein [Mycobacteriales bacterium]|nr:CDP-glycerol glycerophosphotransferase family protein [Mycobacteriales bacterium]
MIDTAQAVRSRLDQVGLETAILVAVACLGITALSGRVGTAGFTAAVAVVAALVAVSTAAADRLRALLTRMRRTPLRSRNLPLADFRPPRLPPRLLMEPAGAEWLPVAALLAGVLVWRSGTAHHGVAIALLVVSAGLAVARVTGLAALLARDHRSKLRTRAVAAVSQAVAQLAPDVLLYFSGSVEELYQLRMWFEPVARLGRRPLVVVRSDAAMDELHDAPFPVISSVYNGTIAALPLPAKVLTLFPTHSGNNLSMLRRPETYCVFIGHGDSDKPDSANPYARVYDEVWVAGPLGRRRYADAAIGVRNDAVHEIGRPQFLVPAEAPAKPPLIVYAPTWEGWGDDPHHSSLPHVGEALVDALLATPGVQVRYRPHPLTGRRDPAVRKAHEAIVRRIGRVPAEEPMAVTAAAASALVCDVSSVVSEYLPYDRPYAVPDTRGLGRRGMTRSYPSTSGGFLIGADLAGLDALVAATTGRRDPTKRARRALIADALGDPSTSQERFAAAVARVLGG